MVHLPALVQAHVGALVPTSPRDAVGKAGGLACDAMATCAKAAGIAMLLAETTGVAGSKMLAGAVADMAGITGPARESANEMLSGLGKVVGFASGTALYGAGCYLSKAGTAFRQWGAVTHVPPEHVPGDHDKAE